MTRVKKTLIQDQFNVDDAEKIFSEYAVADAREKKIQAEMDVQFTKIRDKYQEELTRLAETKTEAFEKLQHFAVTNPDLFVKKKSIDLTHGILGFRTGTPKLKTLKGFTWASTLQLLKEYLPSYVRTVEEPSKDRLLADRESDEVSANLKKVGLEVAQDETFYVEPKKELVA
jgi:phage host-nuclease inhibitor protein Gam